MSSDRLAGTVLDEKYELVRLVGKGGMGTVYEARHMLIDRRFAVKLMHPRHLVSDKVIARFQREARAAAAIGHENIVEVTDMGKSSEGAPYLVMEYLEGQDLGKMLDVEGSLSIPRAANIMVQALSALLAAHGVGIIHRDLKPENLFLIDEQGRLDRVKLLDFGISRFRTSDNESVHRLTPAGEVLGTPSYMSPEQARGDQDLSPKSDIFSMGVIFYRMVTGLLPYNAPNYQAMLLEILTKNPPDPINLNPSLPPELVEIIKIAMAREQEARFGNCFEFRKRLLPFANQQDVPKEIRNIGYADTIEVKKRTFHIQTEVTTDNNVKIKTIVIEGGVVLDAIIQIDEQPKGDIIVQTREAAKLQHDMTVKEVMGGKYD